MRRRRLAAPGPDPRATISQDLGAILTVCDGLIVRSEYDWERAEYYWERADALDAAGIAE